MTCRAEIIVQELDDALYVPVQAVARIGRNTVVYVQTPGGLEPSVVEAGLDNNRMIHIRDGVEEGEKVSLAPPLAPSALPIDNQPRTSSRKRPAPVTSAPAAAVKDTPEGQTSAPAAVDLDQLRNMSSEDRREFIQRLTPEQREELRKRRSNPGRRQGAAGGEGRPR
jgi:hypothetical protein